jgi:hypothetical protein
MVPRKFDRPAETPVQDQGLPVGSVDERGRLLTPHDNTRRDPPPSARIEWARASLRWGTPALGGPRVRNRGAADGAAIRRTMCRRWADALGERCRSAPSIEPKASRRDSLCRSAQPAAGRLSPMSRFPPTDTPTEYNGRPWREEEARRPRVAMRTPAYCGVTGIRTPCAISNLYRHAPLLSGTQHPACRTSFFGRRQFMSGYQSQRWFGL